MTGPASRRIMRGILTAPWEYRDPLEPVLAAQVSSATLMEHVRTIGAWERESGSPGEAQAYDYIERTLKSYGVEVERVRDMFRRQ